LEALLISTGIVALAEIGDKTQLLALVLAAKYRKPVPIILGIWWRRSRIMRWPVPSAPGSPRRSVR
jgi:putative Ca2+/H+ antiporter (TMEM165/GDT1 family)